MHPLVSIVIPSFNQGKYIAETLDSVLAQDYRPIEILVLDGASKDDTLAVLHRYDRVPEIRWWSEPDRGVVDAVNKGLAIAKGEIQAIQSSDDTYAPGAISAAVEAFSRDPRLGLVYGDVETIDASSVVTGRTTLPPWSFAGYVGKLTFIPQPAAFFTKAAADAAGRWREDISYAADAEFYLRIAEKFPVVKLDRLLARYRYHEEQRDRAGRRISHDWERGVRDWIARANPDPALRRTALAGIHLTHAHYLPDEQWLRRTVELYGALALTPSAFRNRDFPRRELIPGRTPIWKFLSRVKRALGFKPRGT